MKGGSTAGFFEKSNMPIYMTMWEFMSGPQIDQVQVGSNAEGIEKVIEADGKYAYFMESSSIDYLVERECRVTKIGGNLDTKVRRKAILKAASLYGSSELIAIFSWEIYSLSHE